MLMKHYFFTQGLRIILGFSSTLISSFAFCHTAATHFNNAPFSQADLNDWKDYANHIRTCAVGNFDLLNPITNSKMEYQIVGLKDNKCTVVQKFKMPQVGTVSSQTVILNCSFPQNDLAIIADATEKFVSDGTIGTANDAASKVVENSCAPGVQNNVK